MSEFVEVKTSELVGAGLDWAVAQVESIEYHHKYVGKEWAFKVIDQTNLHLIKSNFSPSTDWAQGGPLRDEYRVALFNANGHGVVAVFDHDNEWLDIEASAADAMGPTALIALCRAIVAAKMGDVVRVPKELIND